VGEASSYFYCVILVIFCKVLTNDYNLLSIPVLFFAWICGKENLMVTDVPQMKKYAEMINGGVGVRS
jgi:hypothetical protein